jgi:amino acid transporter
MMPVTGGYYAWVKRALGLRAAFYEGWWTWLYTFVDLAIYPVLFVTYATYIVPEVAAYKIPACLVIVWGGAALNILGIRPVGKLSLFLGAAVLLPFIVMGVQAFLHPAAAPFPKPSLNGITFPALGMGLYTVMWNFFGWDNATTYAGEVDNPIRTYIKAIAIAFCTVIGIYAITVLVMQRTGIDATVLKDEGFPVLGELVGGRMLGMAIAIGGLASALGLYNAVLLAVSRVPEVMADDGMLPKQLNNLHPRWGTPYVSIIICAIVVSIMIFWTFTDLIIIDVTLYGAGLFVEFIALIVLRIKAPTEARPFRIPLPVGGLVIMYLLPITVYGIALGGAFAAEGETLKPALFAAAALLSAEVGWTAVKMFWKQKAAT